jgi:hypothetical protein
VDDDAAMLLPQQFDLTHRRIDLLAQRASARHDSTGRRMGHMPIIQLYLFREQRRASALKKR